MAKQTHETRGIKAIAERYLTAMHGGDIASVEGMLSEDATEHRPDSFEALGAPLAVRGRDQISELVRAEGEAWKPFAIAIERLVAEEVFVVAQATVYGTHEGRDPDLPGLDPTGADVEVGATFTVRVEDDQVTDVWIMADTLAVMLQLGVFSADDIPTAHSDIGGRDRSNPDNATASM